MLRVAFDAGRLVIVAGALTVALVGCGDSDDTAPAAETSVTSSAAAPTATTTTAIPDLPAPDLALLQNSLARFVDPTVPSVEKAALVVTGEKYLAQIDTMNAGLANYGRITFTVNSVDVTGTSAVAQVDVTTPFTPTIPMSNLTWDNIAGTWLIAESTVCNLLAFGQAACMPPIPAPPG